jgi:hypothetical protein
VEAGYISIKSRRTTPSSCSCRILVVTDLTLQQAPTNLGLDDLLLYSVAIAALRQKKAFEAELDRIAGTRLTLETQVRTIPTR